MTLTRMRLDARVIAGVIGVVALEGLLLFGGALAAQPAARDCREASADAGFILDSHVSHAWSVPVRTADGGRLIAIETGGARSYFWTDATEAVSSGSVVLGFGGEGAGHPRAGDPGSPIQLSAGEVMFDAQRPLDACFGDA